MEELVHIENYLHTLEPVKKCVELIPSTHRWEKVHIYLGSKPILVICLGITLLDLGTNA